MNRRVWRLAGPVIIANISVPLLGIVDTAVVGHLPEPHYIGAVAVGALIFSYIYWSFGFLRMGTTGFAAQAYGAGDGEEVRATLARALVLAAVIAAAILVVQGPILALAMTLIEGSAQVEAGASVYYAIRIWAVPAALANYVALGWLIGMHNARAMLGLQVFMNGLNIFLDIFFVMELGWGVEGVAWATLIAEYSAAVLAIGLVGRVLRTSPGRWRRGRILNAVKLRRTVAVNIDIFIRTIFLTTAFAYFTAQGAKLGDVTLAANAVLMNFFMLMAFGLDGFAFTAQALVGGAVGARDRATLRSAVVVSSLWAVGLALAYAAIYAAAGDLLVAILTDIPEVRDAAARYQLWVVLLPIVSVWGFQFDGIFVGATRTAEMRNMMAVSLAAFLVAAVTLLALMGNHGLWLALNLFMVVRGISLALYYPRLERSVQS
jgi:MATE family multidrug resistance protein